MPATRPGENYDPHIVPAETAAREDREGKAFGKIPDKKESIDTTGGMTVDKEGLLNNYAIEPEMYIDEPGDLREEQEEDKARRVQEIKDVNSEGGQHRGQGIV